jgi:hypothetical protein
VTPEQPCFGSEAETVHHIGGTEKAADIMETPSAPSHRGHVPWQGLLLTSERMIPWEWVEGEEHRHWLGSSGGVQDPEKGHRASVSSLS